MPLRGLHSDAAYLASFLDTLEGPVVLVGHSYGGSIISHPEVGKASVKALVFVAAFLLDSGENTAVMNGRWPGSKLGESTVLVRPRPEGADLYLKPECFAEVYAADLPPATSELMAAAQRPIEPKALEESFEGAPLWRTVRSWALISGQDCSLPAEAQRFMARRATATTVEVEASHAAPISQSGALVELIVAAAHAVA
jgi:pimeloyl-ACP methyl ester carboxylesterase